jgi:BCD family chlorophyll transporter-like MFS transporter
MPTHAPATPTLDWLGIVRLGLVQSALGAIVVLATSTMNRVMVVEYALPATLPGALVALHYAVQMVRPRFGHGADAGGNATRWIGGGLLALALGAIGAALAVGVLVHSRLAGALCAIPAYALIGLGVGAAGTSLLALMAKRVSAERRGAAATLMWIMMIAGIALSATLSGRFLDPYGPARLLTVTSATALVAVAVALAAIRGIETTAAAAPTRARHPDFRAALAAEWADPEARRFTIFVFVSMLAYSAQELILEPYAGLVFALTPGASARLSGVLHGGAVLGMLAVAAGTTLGARRHPGLLRGFTVAGCLGSALLLGWLALAAPSGATGSLRAAVFALGAANGVFAVAAIGSMMELAGTDGGRSAGVRMGLWGGAQAIAFACGGVGGALAVDAARAFLGSPVAAYAAVFTLEAILFLAAARLAARLGSRPTPELVLAGATGPRT